ncbi:MAG: sodium:solute symporter family protein [Planctomycetota bacterium]|jgi:Na+/proline symporter
MFLADNFLGMHIADWVVLACYFVLIAGIGIWSLKKVKDMSDFFMGGRRFGKIFMMFFAFGAGTSSEQAISVVAGTWRVGLAGIWWQFLWLWATPFYWIVAPVMRRMRALTTADFFEHRYNTSTATLYSLYGIIMAIVFIAGGLFSSGKMVNALTGGELDRIAVQANIEVPTVVVDDETGAWTADSRRVQGYEFAIMAMTVLFVAYGMAGGLGAAIITDFIQGVLTIAFSFMLLPFVFQQIGGFGSLHAHGEVKPGMFDLVASADIAAQLGREPITIFYVFMLSATALCGIVVQPHIMGVCGAGKTEFEGRFGFTVGNFLKRFCTIAWTFTGLACIVWYLTPELSPLSQAEIDQLTPGHPSYDLTASGAFADELFGRAAYEILPTIAPGLIGLLLASLLAAVMSTSDAQMVVGSGLFTENIYKRFIVRNASDSHYLWAGRFAGLVIVALAIVLQSSFTDVIDALKVIIKTPAAIGISFWFGIVWRRWTWQAVWASTVAAVAAWWFVANNPAVLHDQLGLPASMFNFNADGSLKGMTDAWQMFSYLSAGVVVGMIASALTPRQSQEQLDHFFSLIHTPVTPGEHVESPCTLPENPAPQGKKLFSHPDIELPRPTFVGLGGFALAWCCVGLIIWLTQYLSEAL